MASRMPSALLVSALTRRAGDAGGFAAILAKGAAESGGILVQAVDKGRFCGLFERMLDFDGVARLAPCGPAAEASAADISGYLARRRQADPDLWIVELDIADAERFAAETILGG